MSSVHVKNASVLQKIRHHAGDVTSSDFWSNSYLATGSGDKTVVVWEWRAGEGFTMTSSSPLLGHKYGVTCVRFCREGTALLSSSADGYIILWEVKKGQCLHSFAQCNGNGVRSLCVSLDSLLMGSAGEGGTLCLWDLNSKALIRTIEGHDDESIQGVSFSPDLYVMVTGDVTGSFKLWDIVLARENADPLLETMRDAHDLGVNAVDFSPNYTAIFDRDKLEEERTYVLATGGNDHAVVLWQISVCRPLKGTSQPHSSPPIPLATFSQHTSAVSSLRFSTAGQLLASTSIDKTARVWEVSTGTCIRTLEGHSRYIACCAFSSNNNLLVTGSNDKSIWVWDLIGGLTLYTDHFKSPCAFSSNNFTNGQMCSNIEGASAKIVQTLEGHTGGVNTCDFSDRFLATAGGDKTIRLWKWGEGNYLTLAKEMEGHGYSVNQVEFSQGKLASCSLDGSTILWSPYVGEIMKSGFHVSGAGVKCVTFSPDSKLLATGGDDEKASLFRVDTCQLVMEYSGQTDGLTCLGFSPDSVFLVTGSADGHCRLYSVSSATPLVTVDDVHDLGVTSLDFSPVPHTQPSGTKGKYELATCGQDGLVKVWKIDSTKRVFILIWKLAGHGGSVTCVRFSPQLAEIIASTSTDKTCRLWDSYSGECLHVLNHHEGILTCCAFSPNLTLLATGSMDKSVQIWELPKDLAFQSFVASRVNRKQKEDIASWSVSDVNRWLEENNLPTADICGASLLQMSPTEILHRLNIDDVSLRDEICGKLAALRGIETPHELLCPITHQIMRDPVICSDGYTYERSAIESWFGSGHQTSPMTNAIVPDTCLRANCKLRATISAYLATLSKPS